MWNGTWENRERGSRSDPNRSALILWASASAVLPWRPSPSPLSSLPRLLACCRRTLSISFPCLSSHIAAFALRPEPPTGCRPTIRYSNLLYLSHKRLLESSPRGHKLTFVIVKLEFWLTGEGSGGPGSWSLGWRYWRRREWRGGWRLQWGGRGGTRPEFGSPRRFSL